MKICWDNLEKLIYDKEKGCWKNKANCLFFYKERCSNCKNPFLARKGNKNKFCCKTCNAFNNIKNNIGRKHTTIACSNMKKSKEKIKLSNRARNKISKTHIGNKHNWKGGVSKKNIALYDTYAHQISYAEQTRRDPNKYEWLQVKCAYCGKWFNVLSTNLNSRIRSLIGKSKGENRLYCSEECKRLCPIYKKIKYSAEENDTKQLSREVQPELRQMVFERDNWTCRKCNETEGLQCHHIEGIRWEPLLSADIDMCLTYCVHYHRKAHKKEGCSYYDMRCN